MNLEQGHQIADAVLMAGDHFYPHGTKVGVLVPRAWSQAGGGEDWSLEAQVVAVGSASKVVARVRFFQAHPASHERIARTIDVDVPRGDSSAEFAFAGAHEVVGRVVTRRVRHTGYERISVRVENRTPWRDNGCPRELVLRGAFTATHVLIGVEGASLASVLDPPHATPTVTSTGVYPVLLADDLALASPISTCDFPTAPHDLWPDELAPRVPPRVGSKVRLLVPTTLSDLDAPLFAGHVATVVEVRDDFLGVTIDNLLEGRCQYYRADEVEELA